LAPAPDGRRGSAERSQQHKSVPTSLEPSPGWLNTRVCPALATVVVVRNDTPGLGNSPGFREACCGAAPWCVMGRLPELSKSDSPDLPFHQTDFAGLRRMPKIVIVERIMIAR